MADNLPELTPELYEHLRNLAGRIFAERGFGHATIQPTVLLHEAWIEVAKSPTQLASRAHFMAVAVRAMRQILVDRARARAGDKRGGAQAHVTLSGVGADLGDAVGVLAMDRALAELEALDPDAARVVQLRVFGGLAVPEVADVLQISPRTVDRTWRFARAFLSKHLEAA